MVSNADLHHTYDKLFEPRNQLERRPRDSSAPTVDVPVRALFRHDIQYELAHHTVVFGPRYQALLREIFDGPALPDDFSLYLHAPTVTDPSLAPPGCGRYYVLSPVPHLGKANIDWEREAPRYAQKIVRALERHLRT